MLVSLSDILHHARPQTTAILLNLLAFSDGALQHWQVWITAECLMASLLITLYILQLAHVLFDLLSSLVL